MEQKRAEPIGLTLMALCFLVVTSFVFWMSPLGLGFSGQAKEKLASPVTFGLFEILFWAGPLVAIVGVATLCTLTVSKSSPRAAIKIILTTALAIMAAQIAMLGYISL